MTLLRCEACDWTVDTDAIGDSKRSASMRLNNHRKQKHGLEKADYTEEADVADVFAPVGVEGTSPFGGPATSDEIPPTPGDGATRSAGVATPPRRRGFFGRKPKPSTDAPKPTKERTPKPKVSRGARLSTAGTLADLWGFAGGSLAKSGHVPTGRMVAWQGPAAGELLDDVVAGTPVDRMFLQRIVGARGKLDVLFAVLGPPILTFRLEQAYASGDADAVQMIRPMLESAVKNAIPTMLPAMRKARRKEAAAQAALAELLEPDELDALGVVIQDGKPVDQTTGQPVDVGDVFVSMLFAEWTAPAPAPAAEPQEAPAP